MAIKRVFEVLIDPSAEWSAQRRAHMLRMMKAVKPIVNHDWLDHMDVSIDETTGEYIMKLIKPKE